MNILIVDDEYFIVKGIVESVDWTALGIAETLAAYSASQARRVLENTPVDILLTDIEMPRETGLNLIGWCQERGLYPVFLVLTGHKRFDYAQAALNLHIFQYILKPCAESELTETLRLAVTEAKRNAILEREKKTVEAELLAVGTNESDPVSVIKAYVREHLGDNTLDRASIAEEVFMNVDYMSHLFSQKTGKTLSEYITEKRMAKAKTLLAESGYSLQEVSALCGYNSTNYFHRQFKKTVGVTPQQYREDPRTD